MFEHSLGIGPRGVFSRMYKDGRFADGGVAL
jgi:hypothetical protein